MDETKKDPPMLHRDDVPMELAEDIVAHLKEIAEADGQGPVEVKFLGDLTDEERAKFPPEMMEQVKKIHEHLVKCFIDGLCHVCEAKFPGDWPPPDEGEWDLQGWAYYDTDSEAQPPAFACPECEADDGIPKPIILPEKGR